MKKLLSSIFQTLLEYLIKLIMILITGAVCYFGILIIFLATSHIFNMIGVQCQTLTRSFLSGCIFSGLLAIGYSFIKSVKDKLK